MLELVFLRTFEPSGPLRKSFGMRLQGRLTDGGEVKFQFLLKVLQAASFLLLVEYIPFASVAV